MARDPLRLRSLQSDVLAIMGEVFARLPPGSELTAREITARLRVRHGRPFRVTDVEGCLWRLQKRGFVLRRFYQVRGDIRVHLAWSLGPMADALKDAGRFPGEGESAAAATPP